MRDIAPFCKKRVLIFLILFSVFSLRVFPEKSLKTGAKIKIVTTVFPLMEISKAVCGERGEVSLLLPPGAEIHTWRPRPSDIIRVSSADIFIYIGADLEPWIHNLLKSIKNPELRVLEVSSSVSLLDEDSSLHHHGHQHQAFDPHVWLDFEMDQIIVDKIASLLSELDVKRFSLFKRNADLYKDKLRRLDQKFKDGLKDCAHRIFIFGGHSAFGYFARKYNLRQISLYGLSPNSKPTPKQLIKVVELVKEHKIKVIYFEIYVSKKLATVIAKEVGARTLVLNPGANLTKEQLDSGMSFFDIMEKNLENLRSGLICK